VSRATAVILLAAAGAGLAGTAARGDRFAVVAGLRRSAVGVGCQEIVVAAGALGAIQRLPSERAGRWSLALARLDPKPGRVEVAIADQPAVATTGSLATQGDRFDRPGRRSRRDLPPSTPAPSGSAARALASSVPPPSRARGRRGTLGARGRRSVPHRAATGAIEPVAPRRRQRPRSPRFDLAARCRRHSRSRADGATRAGSRARAAGRSLAHVGSVRPTRISGRATRRSCSAVARRTGGLAGRHPTSSRRSMPPAPGLVPALRLGRRDRGRRGRPRGRGAGDGLHESADREVLLLSIGLVAPWTAAARRAARSDHSSSDRASSRIDRARRRGLGLPRLRRASLSR
jgi:hypothetical protein